jgi:hypothetical protein
MPAQIITSRIGGKRRLAHRLIPLLPPDCHLGMLNEGALRGKA